MKSSPLKRRTPLKTGRRRSASREEALARKFWRETVIKSGCVMRVDLAGPHNGRLTAHHILPKDVLKREGHRDRLWEIANGLCLCDAHHSKHHAYWQRVPRELIPAAAFEFAAELGLSHVLDREYPDERGAAA